MTSTHWPHQHFELLSFLAHLNNAWFIKSGRVVKPKICGPGPRGLYNGLPTPLTFGVEFLRTISRFRKRKKISSSLVTWSITRKIRRVRVEVVQWRQKKIEQTVLCTCRVVVLLIKPIAFLTFALSSPMSGSLGPCYDFKWVWWN